MEIERKWLMDGPIIEEGYKSYDHRHVSTKYACTDKDLEIRMTCRFYMGTSLRTNELIVKGPGALCREELIFTVTDDEADRFNALIPHASIEKSAMLYRLPDDRVLVLCHVDPDSPDQFWYAEIEFGDLDTAKNYILPNAIEKHVIKDVTNDLSYKMKNYWRRTRLGMEE